MSQRAQVKLVGAQVGQWNGQRFTALRPAAAITDRAKRYRAQKSADKKPSERCNFCGCPNPRDIHHIDGREENGSRYNLAPSCRSCNVLIGNVMRKNGLGKKTCQYNPRKKGVRRPGAHSLGQYMDAIATLKGEVPGNVAQAVKTVQQTPHSARSEFAKHIWRIRRERYGPTGRRAGDVFKDEVPF